MLVVLTVLIVGFTIWSQMRRKRAADPARAAIQGGEGALSDPRVATPVDILFLALFVFAIWEAIGWPRSVAMLPLVCAVPGALLCAGALWRDVRLLRARSGGAPPPGVPGTEAFDLSAATFFLLWVVGIVVATVLFGQLVALPAGMAAYLLLRGDRGWKLALAYGVAGWLFLYFMFGRLINVIWYPSVLLG